MPKRSLKFCAHKGCEELVTSGYCEVHQAEYDAKQKQRAEELNKKRASSTQRGYDGRWQKARLIYLKQHPLCVECEKAGKVTPATVVDHIIPHKGNKKLFWNRDNWQSLCKACHDAKTAKEDGRWR